MSSDIPTSGKKARLRLATDTITMPARAHIVIVGAGFGGRASLACAVPIP